LNQNPFRVRRSGGVKKRTVTEANNVARTLQQAVFEHKQYSSEQKPVIRTDKSPSVEIQ
jgi:hypothetical protein